MFYVQNYEADQTKELVAIPIKLVDSLFIIFDRRWPDTLVFYLICHKMC